jgi:GT2 family glycosyltransferase
MPRDEDREFSARIVDAGYTIGYLPDGERCQHISSEVTEGNESIRRRKFLEGEHVWMKTPKGVQQTSRWGIFGGAPLTGVTP